MRKIFVSLTICLSSVLAGAQEHERETSASDQCKDALMPWAQEALER